MPPSDSIRYDFLSPPKIVFGWGRRVEAGALAAELGRRAWIVSGSRTLESRGILEELNHSLAKHGVSAELLGRISHEPEVDDVDAAVARLRNRGLAEGDLVLGIGGGSALDLAKAVAALATNRHGDTVRDFLEGVGRGLRLERPPLPMLAMPTTAGTGTEATKNAVISCYAPPFKKSLRSERMLPRIVLVDPELSVSVLPYITAHTGMDAVTQLVESYLSRRSQPVPEALCRHGLELAVAALPQAVADGGNRPARERMAHAALLSGLALANSGLGMAHGVAAALGVHARVPHGLACAVMLPAALRANREVCRAKLARLAPILTGRDWPSQVAAVDAVVASLSELAVRIGIPSRLSALGVRAEQLPAIVRSSRGNSMDGNPRDISDAELHDILEKML